MVRKDRLLGYTQVIAVVKSTGVWFGVFFTICYQTIADVMPLWGKCERHLSLLKKKQAELREVLQWGEQRLVEQKAVDCRAGCALGRYFMLSAGTETTKLVVVRVPIL